MNDENITKLQQRVSRLRYELQTLISLDEPYEVLNQAGKRLDAAEEELYSALDAIEEAAND